MRWVAVGLCAAMSLPALCASQTSTQEDKVWALEKRYWQCVQANDLEVTVCDLKQLLRL